MMKRKMIRAAAALALLVLLPALALADQFALVHGGRLNLREYPSTTSRSLGKYGTGSWVRVVGTAQNGFLQVRTMDGKGGYMSSAYLNLGAAGGNQATVRYANGGYVNLRGGPSLNYNVVVRVTSGNTVTVLDESYEWNRVTVVQNGQTYSGYMHDSFLNKTSSSARVTTRNGGKVNLRSGPGKNYGSIGSLPTGTVVSVLLRGSDWAQISAGGVTGFMSTDYLSASSTGSTSGTTTSSTVAYVNNPRSTQVLNLRETPSRTARSIGQYRNGTQVKVVSRGATWCEVYVGTRHGYMMTQYLSFSYVAPVSTPVVNVPVVTPQIVYVTPTPTPIYVTVAPTATPTPVPGTPTAGTLMYLMPSSSSTGNKVAVYNDKAMTSVKGYYDPGKAVTMLQYEKMVSMILIDCGVGYCYSWEVSYTSD